jgi:hypothetical protein
VFNHLEPVTPAVNVRRAAAIKTHCPQGHPYPAVTAGTRRRATCNRTKPWAIRPERCGVSTTNYQYGCRCESCRRFEAQRGRHRRAA